MNRLCVLIGVVLLLFATNVAQTEVLVWHRSEMFDNNTPIPQEKIPLIRYTIYWGESSFGPWNSIAQVSDNSLILLASALPAYGGTMYYTGDAKLDNFVSSKGEPLKYVRPILPSPSPGCVANRFLEKI